VDVAEFGLAPRDDPLGYPGRYHTRSYLLADDEVIGLDRLDGTEPLDALLQRHRAAPIVERTAVLAIGSNAAPAQLHRKLAAGSSRTVPVIRATLTGVAIGFSRHITAYGSIPMTPAARDGAVTDVFVTYLDADQLGTITASEGANYELAQFVGTAGTTLTLELGPVVPGFAAFVTTRGVLRIDGQPVDAPVTQVELWGRLAHAWRRHPDHADLPATPAEIVHALRSRDRRPAILAAFDAVTARR
jgi:hypothetical protein